MLAGGANAPGKLAAFSGVRAFPSRIKCAKPGVACPARGVAEPRRARDDRVGQGLLMLDTARIRPDFPILTKKENGSRLVYLDNAATSPKPRKVIDAIVDYYRFHNANVHRGAYALAVEATDAYEAAPHRGRPVRERVGPGGRRLHARYHGVHQLVAASWGRDKVGAWEIRSWSPAMDHHSNIVPWQILCQEKGATLRMVEITGGRTDRPVRFRAGARGEAQDRRLPIRPRIRWGP